MELDIGGRGFSDFRSVPIDIRRTQPSGETTVMYQSLLKNSRLVVIACLFAASAILIAPPTSAHASSQGDFLGRINGLRASKGLSALAIDGRLSSVAQGWANHMADANAISHNPALSSIPGNWTKVGENVGTGASVGVIFDALVASPGHYRNMVDGAFNSIGIGIATGSDGRLYTTHNFAAYPGAGGESSRPKSTSAPAAKTPSKPPASAPKQPAATPKPAAPKPNAAPDTKAPPAENSVAPAPAETPQAGTQPDVVADVPSQQLVQGFSEISELKRQG